MSSKNWWALPTEGQDRFEVKYREIDSESAPGSDRAVLCIMVDGEEVASFADGGEPEDQSFGRDWSWVWPALARAYHLGALHARETP